MNDDGNGAWLLPRLGDLDAALFALDALECALTNRPSESPSTDQPELPGDQVADLVDALAASVNLCAFLVKLLELKGYNAAHLIEIVRTHQRARADLDSLDQSGPFDG